MELLEFKEAAAAYRCVPLLDLYKLVNTRSDTDLRNAQSAPRGGERATVC